MNVDMKILNRHKAPSSPHKYVGLEFEFLLSSERRFNTMKKLLIAQGLQYYCHLGTDGSVGPVEEFEIYEQDDLDYVYSQGDSIILNKGKFWDTDVYDEDYMGCEIRVLAPQGMLHEILGKLDVVFKKVKAKVNATCGFHVHLDMRQRDYKKAAEILIDKRAELRSLCDPGRISNTFCKPLTKAEITNHGGVRYKDINVVSMGEHKTLEVRLHEGTLDMTEAFMFTKWLVFTIDGIKFDKELKDYVKQTSETNKKYVTQAS